MLNTLSVWLPGANGDGIRRAGQSMLRQGFSSISRLSVAGVVIEGWSHPSQRGEAASIVRAAVGAACCAGPLWYRGRFGSGALQLLIDEVGAGRAIDEMALRGNYAMFVGTERGCVLMNDSLGLVRIYTTTDRCFHSTSWLAACAYMEAADIDERSAVEYVLLGASHSDRTVMRGVQTLPLGNVLTLDCDRPLRRRNLAFGDRLGSATTIDGAVDQISSHLGSVFRESVTAFPGKVRTALSGGFDSRLILAGLRASGARPELFVYGDGASEDVRIAKLVAASAGMPLRVVDKRLRDKDAPPITLDRLTQGAMFFDGLPVDGVVDAGSDQSTRLQQSVDGYVAMNGGGGEIFRNFFHLPDRQFHAIDIVRTFYRGFDRAVFRRAADFARYEAAMVASMQRVLVAVDGVGEVPEGARLTRSQVELLYPLFRCHFWMAVNNSINVRYGYYTTPLVDLGSVRLSSQLPLAWKNAGRLESLLIARLDRTVAEQISAYGFRVSDGPSRRAAFAEWAMEMRPVVLRPAINALRRRLRRVHVPPARLAEFRALLPGEWRIDPWLDVARLPDEAALRRALSIEVVWRRILAS